MKDSTILPEASDDEMADAPSSTESNNDTEANKIYNNDKLF